MNKHSSLFFETIFWYFYTMIRPAFLEKGDTILLVSPAGKIAREDVYPTVCLLENWGLDVKIAPHSFNEHHRFAGTTEERIADMQAALDATNIKAILCNRGGYGSIQLIDKLKFTAFMKKPKWLIGFSDITVFHSYFNTILKCETLHAPMPINLSKSDVPKQTLSNFKKALFGEQLAYKIPTHSLNIHGEAKGELIGGNLATLSNLIGTGISYNTKGKILFVEEVDEPIHKIDQMLLALKFSGKLASLKGLIVGSFTNIDTEPYFGRSLQQLIYDTVLPYGYPVIFDFPVGHTPENYPMYVGRRISMDVSSQSSFVYF